jgi:flagellar protein FlaG
MGLDQVLGTVMNGAQISVVPSSVKEIQSTGQARGLNTSGMSQNEERLYPPFSRRQLDKLVNEANQILSPETTEIHYVLYEKLNEYYVQVEDTMTHQVIREIPPKKFMDMYAAIAEKLGLIVNKKI